MAELTIRDWMVIIGVLLITAVLLDAWRRVRSEKYSRVKVKLADPGHRGVVEGDEDLHWLKELPNGGARTVERGDLLRAAGHKERPAPVPEAKPEPPAANADDDPAEPETVTAGMSAEGHDPENLDWLDGMGAERQVEPESEPSPPGRLPRDVDPEVFMLNVVARDARGFKGEDILHILLACDLRFGDMNFFHRHEFEAGKGAIQFSVANMMQPGVFDIDNMADFNTPGLVFFLTLPGPEDMMKAFDYMLETAQAVARNLGGDVLDESRSVLTKQTLEHSRQQIRDLERRMLAKSR
ncbi:cell division protein ZipA [Seongchinamella unica]|uniref:Cell division protein ZipA n=1 Tax=Seongchinamella unica TaxID=2547392 RepID=A0A4R5LSK7_9GAMM|nr:cell division protein ZipA [Seongchinamella unica]TDG13899.1 cell division protein ZipA [Seongchinamella unica]